MLLSRKIILLILSQIAITALCFAIAVKILGENLKNDLIKIEVEQTEHIITAQLFHNLDILSATLGNNLTLPIYHIDFTKMLAIIEKLKSSTKVIYAYIYDNDTRVIHDGSQFAKSYGQDIKKISEVKLDPSRESKTVRVDEIVYINIPVFHKKNWLGGISLALEYTDIDNKVKKSTSLIKSNIESQVKDTQLIYIYIWFITTAVLSSISYLLIKRLTTPLIDLAKTSKEISNGNKETKFHYDSNDEIGQLSDSLNIMTEEISKSNKKLEKIAYLDELTGLYNRRHFTEQLDIQLEEQALEEQYTFLSIIDLDKFKKINDTEGHDIGDEILKISAQRITQACEESKLDYAIATRIGGDEFAIIGTINKRISRKDAFVILDNFLNNLQSKFWGRAKTKKRATHISISIGTAIAPIHSSNKKALMKQSDLALYQAKNSGRNSSFIFNQDLEREFILTCSINNDFKSAMEHGDIKLVFQPIYDLNRNVLMGFECLARWNHPKYGFIPPDRFISELEKSNKINTFSLWLIDQAVSALQYLESFKNINLAEFIISINISAENINHGETAEKINEKIRKAKKNGYFVSLEITETSMMKDIEKTKEILKKWKDSGARILIDDFGTGYSSLSYLQQLPIDILKIDKSFIDEIHKPNCQAVIEAISVMAKTLKFYTLAEGIEDEYQIKLAKHYNIHYGQGFHYSKPISIELIADMINKECNNETYSSL